MPYKKRSYRRRKPKRKMRRKKYSVPRAPLAKKLYTKLRYSDSFSLDPPAATAVARVWRANGMYDPDQTTVGHQPRGFDQLMALYEHFTVIGCKLTVTFAQQATGTDTANVVGVSLRSSNTAITSLNDHMEYQYQKHRIVNSQNGDGVQTIIYQCNPNKFLGRSKPLSDPDLKGSASSDPTEQAYFHIFAAGLDGANGGLCNVNATIDYLCVLTEPVNPAQS